MIKPAQLIILFAVCIVPKIATATQCNQSCRKAGGPPMSSLPSPFGFSSGCQIQLKCTVNGTAAIDDFPVQQINPDSIILGIPAKCGRPFQILQRLFSRNYAPSTGNGILLQSCTSNFSGCVIPKTEVQTTFELLDCGNKTKNKNNISCYSEKNKEIAFMNYTGLMDLRCGSFFSAISVDSFGDSPAVSLGVQVVKLVWWLEGECQCSENANCTEVSAPIDGGKGYRCRCLDGFHGDGYKNGSGCRKAQQSKKTTSFHTKKVAIVVGSIVVVMLLIISLVYWLVSKRRREVELNTLQASEEHNLELPIFDLATIARATNNFSTENKIGEGGFGPVYKAWRTRNINCSLGEDV